MTNRAGSRRLFVLRTTACALMAAVLILPVVGCAARKVDSELEEKPAKESEVTLPAFPQAENLVAFEGSATSDNKYLVDSESLSVGNDGVVRYTLVIVSSSGAQNVSYEAMNCLTSERRLYALGRPDRTWSKARSDQWVKIRDNTVNRHYAELYTNYFCPIGISIRNADEARQVLRRGGHPSVRLH
jgi:hypothetical protein